MTATSPARTGVTRSVTIDAFTLVDTDRALSPAELDAGSRTWLPAVVPGGVHESLIAAGAIEHPYYDRNEEAVRWIEERDWWFRTTFEAPADRGEQERLVLVFHGLDTVVDLWLNGEPLGHHENMFRPAEFDVTDRLRDSNDLLLRFSPPLAGLTPAPVAVDMFRNVVAKLLAADPQYANDDAPEPAAPPESTGDADNPMAGSSLEAMPLAAQRRKAAFSWGWDFGPRVPSIGIWRPVELRRVPRAAVTGHHVRTDAIDTVARTARLSLLVETSQVADGLDLSAVVTLTSPSGAIIETALPVTDGVARGNLVVDEAQLWWTHDLGEPALYDVRIELREGEDLRDVVLDRVGLRTIAVDRPDDPEGGRLFRFVLNGLPIFARGGAWLPASMMVGSVTAERQRELVRLARDGNMNMLRIWGGGIYEHEAFYRATDELGVLVWQDFMFACTDYPSDDENLRTEVTLEAEYQVKRLRNHPSMAVWAGNNEVETLHGTAFDSLEPGPWGWDFFHRILPEAVERYDGGVPYWPGSPWGENETEGAGAVNGVLDGDRHAWEVWHGMDAGAGGGEYTSLGEARHYRRYANDRGKFISEFGIHAAPVLSTLERWIPADELSLHSESFDAHNKDHPKDKHETVLEIVTGLPRDVEHYVDFTMASQAEGLKFGIEHYRRRQPHCSGTLVWQFNDVWPGFSWSVVDYDTVPKAAYYAAKRAFAPVLASFRLEGDALELWVSNSTPAAVSTEAAVTLGDAAGPDRWSERVPVILAAGESSAVWSRTLAEDERAAGRYAWVESAEQVFPANRTFFGEIKDLPLSAPVLRTQIEKTGPTTAEVVVSTDTFTYLVRVTATHSTARFDDNYLDLRPGEARTITVSDLPEGFELSDLAVGSYAGA